MNKVKMLFIAVASVLGVGGAFATTARVDCTLETQYKNAQGTPVDANYICTGNTPTCTYHKVGTTYTPCRFGVYSVPPHLDK